MSKTGSPQKKPSISFSENQENPPQGGALSDLDNQDKSPNKSPTRRRSTPTGSAGSPARNASPERKSPSPAQSNRTPSQSPKEGSITEKTNDDSYIPSPYTFRAPARAKSFVRMNAKCPPFYLQLDHTLAVIWTLFSDNPPVSLGIVQLQWALNFLQGIYTRKGEHPKDVSLCIQAIEDLLLAKYADMAKEVSFIEEEEKKKRMRKVMPSSSDASMKSKQTVCESETCFGRMCLDVDRVLSHEANISSSPMPFSVNYSDIVDKVRVDYDQMYSKHSRASTTISGVELPQENTMEFLEKWRADQIKKIQAEMLRLKSIETYIGCAETNIDSVKDALQNDDTLRDRPQKFYY
ncbi:uncharacterized protein [Onthophagus taurus]|uniref:uncharacterized protein n=1 Tax=Onthophagus taurus TaxID=166361 RepID=UPI000C2063EB|nr:uncharacterized protein LOC111427299 [Onthophagus taurus]